MPRDPGPGEVLVKIRAAGICGSDLHWYSEGGIGWNRSVYPQVLGHEPAGEIVSAGPQTNGFPVGQKVAIEPAITCGHCGYCLTGHHNNCTSAVFMGGPQMPGFFREYAVVPARNAVPVPDGMTFAQITLLEPLAVMLHILELVEIRLGDTVAVMGAGPIGLLMASVARIAGASRVFVADRVPHRLKLAASLGADLAVDLQSGRFADTVLDLTQGRGVDLVFDAAGALETINSGIRVAKLGGTVVLIGIPVGTELPVDLQTAMAKELKLQTVKRSNHNVHGAIDLIRSGRVSTALVTHRLPLEQTPQAFEMLASYADGVGKAIIEIP